MAVFKAKEFVEKLKWLVNDIPTVYYSGSDWSKWNGRAWNMDCVVSIKSLLWGFKADKSLARGGANYLSNGVADFTTFDGLNKYCTDVSTDFSNLVVGEYLSMNNTSHCGVYLGDGKVYECTAAWDKKCMITDIDKSGNRIYKGNVNAYKWTHHGKLIYIDYTEEPEKKPATTKKYNVGDMVTINGVYVSSDSTEKLTPQIKTGIITRIVENRNPYLLNNGDIGWVNDDCIVSDDVIDTYKVVSGDTLWGIAKKFYGDGNKYSELAKYNNIENPDLIYPNQILKIPKI